MNQIRILAHMVDTVMSIAGPGLAFWHYMHGDTNEAIFWMLAGWWFGRHQVREYYDQHTRR